VWSAAVDLPVSASGRRKKSNNTASGATQLLVQASVYVGVEERKSFSITLLLYSSSSAV